jgi:ubiquinone/menaquinone biosynthesis C-methylase UbiE
VVKSKGPKTDYSKIAEYYDNVRPAPADIWLSKIIEYGKIDSNCAVLDVGCGTGRFPLCISTMKNPMICALEPSPEMLKQAIVKDESRVILWIRGDGQKLPFREGKFDCIYMTLVIHHLENKEMALQEIHRVLKKGGNCVIMTNSHSRIKRHVLRHFPGIVAIDLKRFPTVPYIRKTMRKIGFRNIYHCAVQHGEEYISTDEYLERVRNKYISTLTLLSEEAFLKGLKIFKKRTRKKYGAQIKRILGFDFVIGQK